MRASSNGKTTAFQADYEGSIPFARSNSLCSEIGYHVNLRNSKSRFESGRSDRCQ